MPNWLSRMFNPSAVRAAEGAYRPGPYFLKDGWLPHSAGQYMNWWQMGYSLQPYGETSAMVEACVSRYAQTTAMCPGDHWRALDNGGRERVTNSGLSRVLRVHGARSPHQCGDEPGAKGSRQSLHPACHARSLRQ